MTAGGVHEDATHDLRRDTKKMGPVLPVRMPLVNQPDEHLVDKGCRLQGMVRPLVPKPTRSNAVELRIDERQQLVKRGPAAATPVAEQCRHIARRVHRSLLSNCLDRGAEHSTHGLAPRVARAGLTRYARGLRDLLLAALSSAHRRESSIDFRTSRQEERMET